MEIKSIGRPRNVGWARAGALLYGDWGTSKAYVIGIGLGLIGFASLPHLLAVCAITALVGINYIWVCKYFPHGGGVYSSAGLHSRRLAMIGGLLLLADFIITASLSCLDAFHYLGFEHAEAKKWAIMAIFMIGALNFFGPKHTGGIAVWLALPTMATVLVLIVSGFPHLGDFKFHMPSGGFMHNWVAFVGMILALSGVEAAASNTGVMQLDPDATPDKPSVHRTSSKALLIVLAEVVGGTALLSVMAMCLPEEAKQHSADLLRYMGETFVAPWFGKVVGVVFAMLLLSAVNTAIAGMVSILYVMARDEELPHPFTMLNNYGVPWLSLIAATIMPVLVLNVDDSVEGLASLYAIGVIGAIAIDVGSTSFAKTLNVKRGERIAMRATLVLLTLVWITIAASKHGALLFVIVVVGVGMILRGYMHRKSRTSVTAEGAPGTATGTTTVAAAESPENAVLGTRLLVAARGWTPALQFALEAARLRSGQLLVLFIRELSVQGEHHADWKKDPAARRLFERLLPQAGELKVHPLYSISDVPAETIVELAATFGVDTVILGGTKRARLVNLLKGNVVTRVASSLPDPIRLLVVG